MALYMGKVKIAGIGSGGGTGGSEHVQMTQAEYDALSASGGLTAGTIYMTPDTGSGGGGGGTCNFNLPAISSAVEDIVEENNTAIGSVVESKLTNNNSTINGYITGNNTTIGNIVDQKVVANNPAIGTVVQDKLTANNSAISSIVNTIVVEKGGSSGMFIDPEKTDGFDTIYSGSKLLKYDSLILITAFDDVNKKCDGKVVVWKGESAPQTVASFDFYDDTHESKSFTHSFYLKKGCSVGIERLRIEAGGYIGINIIPLS